MKVKVLQLCVLCWFSAVSALYAQTEQQPAVPVDYGSEMAKVLSSTSNAEARANGEAFSAAWSGGSFSEGQQQKIVEVYRQMLDKRFKPLPQLSHYFGILAGAAGQGLPSAEIDNLLNTLAKVVEKEGTRQVNTFLATVNGFFKNDALYHSNYSSLYADGGNLSFEYIEPETAQEAAPGGWGATEEAAEEVAEEDHFSDWDTPAVEEEQGWSSDWSSWETTEGKAEDKATPAEEDALPVYIDPFLPTIEGAVIRFEGVKLSIVSSSDSLTIRNTSGSFMPIAEVFVGEGGKISWQNTGLDAEKVFVELDKYSFETSKAALTAENVRLTYAGKLAAPVEGVFEYENSRYKTPADAQYPRFKSYESNISVSNLGGDELVYKGGFSLMGSKIYSSSVYSGMASIEVKEQGQKKFKINSRRFNLQDTLIQSDLSAIVIYHGEDSIFHPAVTSRYNTATNVLTLIKNEGAFKYTPFVSSYFDMDIMADILRWDVNADSLDISILSGKSQVPAFFESQEYFNMERFERLKGMYSFHPLQMAVGYARKINSGTYYVDDMARDLRQDSNTLSGAMQYLMQNGFIDYNVETGLISINRKGFHYVLSSNQRKDFDDLLIASLEPSLPNATLNFQEQELKVRGIDKFYISRSKDVYIQPENDAITLLSNRDFRFDGQVHAGSFIFMGHKMRFDYDSFLIDMPMIDSIKFDVDQFKETKKLHRSRLDNQLVESSGTLKIDLPKNKSSRRNFPEFPVFNASRGSTVYFNGEEIAEGKYGKDLNFTIPPFEIDSLSSSDPAAIAFEGTFSSGGIVPDFKTTLRVLEDNSLGFTQILPAEGYKLYNGSAVLYDTLKMDSKGLYSSGHIEYLTSTLYSNYFRFFEDSVLTSGSEIVMEQGVVKGASFPVTSVKAYDMRWYPKRDSMYVENRKEPFQLFGGVASLDGSFLISSKGLNGAGKLNTQGADVESPLYTFNQRDFIAENARFTIEASNSSKPILLANDVRIAYNLDRGMADIEPEVEGVAAIEFPYAQYKTSIPKASWNFAEKTVSMSKPQEFDLSKSYFYSTRSEQDSLVFNAENAIYNIDAQTLNVSGIPYIKVADAKITPENNEVLILENARLQSFQNASIVIDTLNEYHHLDNGKIDILSRNKFIGSATYRLVNAVGDTFAIEFNSFKLVDTKEGRRKKSLQTVSSGTIKAEDLMVISPGMLFRGNATMYADKPALELNGLVKLDLKSIPDYNTWIKYSSTGDQREIAFNFEESVTEDGSPLVAGVYFDSKTNELYPAFVTQKRSANDYALFQPAGLLTYDAVNNEYRIEEQNKKLGKSYAGRIFAYNENNGEVRFEGPLNFMEQRKDAPNVKAAGLGKGSFQSGEFDMNALMVFDFDLPVDAEVAMGEDVLGIVQRMGLPQANTDRVGLLYKIAEIVGEEAAREYEERSLAEYLPLYNAGPELLKTLTLSGVNLKWSAEQKSWYSNGKIGLSNIGETDANALLDGFIEMRRSAELGNVINIFLQVSPGIWYYFNYEGNRLFTVSSYDAYNEIIKRKSKAHKAKPGEYAIATSDVAETLQFVNRFRKDYYGIETPYQLNTPVAPAANAGTDPFSTTGSEQPKADTSADDKDGF
ncbi:hypothetical protein [Nafulsella turpanensis]|uniref:hypothetical protein n=1 Tax=Nafulsella turpanensis TaxID=1265690 RepID=UPI0003603353|nr:hypothetical protein [Nafulsella turpanensis]